MKRKAIIYLFLSTSIITTISAEKTFKGEVVDLYGSRLKDISISVRGQSYAFPDNHFELKVNEGDTIKFELDGNIVKDTVLTNPNTYNVIRVKPKTIIGGENFVAKPPVFQNFNFVLDKFISKNLCYPVDAIKDSISGVAHVRFSVDENGVMSDFSVRPSISPSIDQEAIRLVRMLPRVKPGLVENHYIKYNSYLPICFNLREYLYAKETQTENNSTQQNKPDKFKIPGVYNRPENQPEFPGGLFKMIEFRRNNTEYPADVVRGKISNTVILRFVVDSTGSISNIMPYISLTPSLDSAAIRMVKKMPKWIPGRVNGRVVSSWFELPVRFELNQFIQLRATVNDSLEQNAITNNNEIKSHFIHVEPFIIVENMPEFPGGNEQMTKYLSNNLHYPIDAEKKGTVGMVLLSFIVDNTGKIEDITVVRSLGPSLDEAAIAAIQKMPRWKPGRQGGRDVPVKFTLPIKFALK
ncbi:MAG: TonB family protein [Bacteroidota bacterium]|nr:TonB family protein [Bacteroidota bacterium]